MALDDIELIRLYTADPPREDGKEFLDDVTLQNIIATEGSVNKAATQVWEIKMASYYDWYLANIDGAFLSRDQVFAHCKTMRDMFNIKSNGLVSRQFYTGAGGVPVGEFI